MITLSQKLFISILIFVSSNSVKAQITVTMDDLLGLIGSSQITVGTDSTSFNVGSSGENQTWDFRNVEIDDSSSISSYVEFLSPQQTTYAGMYPGSNLAGSNKLVFLGLTVSESITFSQITPSYVFDMGGVSKSIFSADTAFIFKQDTVSPLPVSYGSTWFIANTDTFGFPPTVSIDSTTYIIDAYGIIRLPIGDFESLRIKGDSKITQTYLGIQQTATYISYQWISKSTYNLVTITSQANETDPNFSNGSFSRIDELNTSVSVEESNAISKNFKLSYNYPNPFNPSTTIEFSIPEEAFVELKVYDILGKEVAILVNDTYTSGIYKTEFNGDNLPSGIYIAKMNTGSFTKSFKMMLLK